MVKKLGIVGFLVICGVFSLWLMFSTFGVDTVNNQLLLASRVWSDFGAHIPLIRSFSFGNNWPIEYPLFPGEPIRYHFLFYTLVGFLERIGLRLDFAFNLPSSLGFFFLLLMIYKTAHKLTQRRLVAIISVIFFLFNGTLSFLNFFQQHPELTLNELLTTVRELNNFPSFGPWDGSLVTAFGNLNVYTNQRHLAPSLALLLLIIYQFLTLKPVATLSTKQPWYSRKRLLPLPQDVLRKVTFIVLITGFLLFLNQATLLPVAFVCVFAGLFLPLARAPLLISLLFVWPFLWLFFTIATPSSSTPAFEIGYLTPKPISLSHFLEFWLHNLGLHLVLIPLGMLSLKRHRWLIAPAIMIFVSANVFRFSTDMINNHKLINAFMILGGIYSAVALIMLPEKIATTLQLLLAQKLKHLHILKQKKLNILAKQILFFVYLSLIAPAFVLLTFSGILDFMVIKNDHKLQLTDIPTNQDANFIYTMTKPTDIVLNSTWFYHPASLAGRKIYSGYSFFTWSAGYDTYARERKVTSVYQSNDLNYICLILHQENIDMVELNDNPEQFLQPISQMWKSLDAEYYNLSTGVTLYRVASICQQK